MQLDLDFLLKCAEKEKNVLLTGRKGVGKTHILLDVLGRAGYKVKYLSAANVDPYLEFVGIPEKTADGKSFSMLMPDWIGEYDALFIDELGRAIPAVNNALLEVLQFKSMHGKPLGIKLVWAATNPHDDEVETYNVHVIDPAILDRFPVKIDVDYDVSEEYFVGKYQEIGKCAVEFWRNNLTTEQQIEFSPRRLETAVEMFIDGFDLKYVVPNKGKNVVNSSELMAKLDLGVTTEKRLTRFLENNDIDKATEFLKVSNNYNEALPHIIKNYTFAEFFTPIIYKINKENFISISNNPEIVKAIAKHIDIFNSDTLKLLKKNTKIDILLDLRDTFLDVYKNPFDSSTLKFNDSYRPDIDLDISKDIPSYEAVGLLYDYVSSKYASLSSYSDLQIKELYSLFLDKASKIDSSVIKTSNFIVDTNFIILDQIIKRNIKIDLIPEWIDYIFNDNQDENMLNDLCFRTCMICLAHNKLMPIFEKLRS